MNIFVPGNCTEYADCVIRNYDVTNLGSIRLCQENVGVTCFISNLPLGVCVYEL